MHSLCRALLLSFALGMLAWVGCFAAEAPSPPKLQALADFFDNPAFGAAELSPDGRHLAVVVNNSKGRDRLAVFELATMKPTVVAEFNDADIGNFQWVNNRRLVYDSRDKNLAPGERTHAPWMYAVDRDGSNYKRLVDVRRRFCHPAHRASPRPPGRSSFCSSSLARRQGRNLVSQKSQTPILQAPSLQMNSH